MKTSNTSNSKFEALFFEERLKSEKFKELLLIIFLSLILFALLINSYLLKLFATPLVESFKWFGLVLIILIIRTLFIRKSQNFRKQYGAKRYLLYSYINTFIEANIPTVLIIIVAINFDIHTALISPIVFFYFVFIILSIFELEMMLSIFTGFVSAVSYLVISLILNGNKSDEGSMYVLTLPVYYIGKSLFLFFAGVAAGLLAGKIKRSIINSFNLIEERENLEKTFGQQVSKEIVDEFIKNKLQITSRKREGTVMFLDIRDFSKYCGGKSPEDINDYQNKALGFMIDIVNKNKGIVNQILGDGFMATFGAPVWDKDHTQNAVDSATEIIKALISRNENKELPGTNVGIGIHTGEVVTGNVGTEDRKQYSVTGSTVILAARLEQLNKEFDSSIIVSKDVIGKVKIAENRIKSLGEVTVKGFAGSLEVYRIL